MARRDSGSLSFQLAACALATLLSGPNLAQNLCLLAFRLLLGEAPLLRARGLQRFCLARLN